MGVSCGYHGGFHGGIMGGTMAWGFYELREGVKGEPTVPPWITSSMVELWTADPPVIGSIPMLSSFVFRLSFVVFCSKW